MALVISPHAPKLHGIHHRVIDPAPVDRSANSRVWRARYAPPNSALLTRSSTAAGSRSPTRRRNAWVRLPGPNRPLERECVDHVGVQERALDGHALASRQHLAVAHPSSIMRYRGTALMLEEKESGSRAV